MSATPKLGYGGQAVLEGVMMRGRRWMAVAVRAPDKSIVFHSQRLPVRLYSGAISRIPFLRGLIMLWDSLVLGMAALTFSAEVAMQEPEGETSDGNGKPAEPATDIDTAPRKESAAGMKAATWGSIALALVFGLGFFFVLPLVLVGLFERAVEPSFWSHLVEGLIRLGLLVGYVAVIGLTRDIRRVYQYHGAEHMTIHAFEHDTPLTPESIEQYPTAHPRCGTAFLLLVVAVSILVFAVVGTPDLITRIVSRILLIPVIAGIAYEILRFGGTHYEKNFLVRLIVAPGLLLQAITTKRPERDMIEVAIASFQEVRRREELAEAAALPHVSAEALS